MEFIDLKQQQAKIKKNLDNRIKKVLEHGKYIMGPEVFELEKKLAEYIGVKHCITCASGTDGLLMALMAMDIGQGDAVFTTPFTFIATAEVINLLGATPIFVDIDERTFNIDPNKLEKTIISVLGKSELKARAVIPVDIFGQPADYRNLARICNKYNLLLLEDAAQSFGGSIAGKKAGAFGYCATTSFFPAKPLGCYGDGGAIFTNDDILSEKLKSIRVHGKGINKYDNIRIGINGRLDTIQAAILLSKLEIFDDELKKKNKIASKYNKLLGNNVTKPYVQEGYTSAWAQYSVLSENEEDRDTIISKLKKEKIPSAIYYNKPLHLQNAFDYLNYREGDFLISEDISKRIFSLPMHAYLLDDEIIKIASYINLVNSNEL